MHCIQTSGNCVRNVTSDPFAGVAVDELEDPRPWCEILRQWSTLHPEFNWLPRKFKIAVTGAAEDRAATAFHDIGLRIVRGPRRRERLPRARRRRHGAHALCRPGDPRVPAEGALAVLRRGDPARVQPARPPRQHLQGAHQDPGQCARHRQVPRGRRGGLGRDKQGRNRSSRRRGAPHRVLFRAARLAGARRPRRGAGRAPRRAIRAFADWYQQQRARPSRARVMPRS